MFTTKTKILMGIAAALFVTTLATGFYYISTLSQSDVTINDLKDMTKEEVLAWAKSNNVSEELIRFTYSYDETAETDTVISQSVSQGETLQKGNTLEITLSNGPDPDLEVTLSDLKNKTMAEAQEWFEKNRFTDVQYSFAKDETVEADHVIKTLPEEGQRVKRSASVKVTISSGSSSETSEETELTVPDFSGYSRTNIQAWGSTNKVTISFTSKSSDTVAKDRVISQTPKAGSSIRSGSTVSIVLSLGKGINVVSYIGKTSNEAESWAKTNGLKASVSEVYSENKAGTVIAQTPSSGSVGEGSSITFQISIGPVTVDDYTGRTKAEFESYIANLNTAWSGSANIKVSVSEEESDKTPNTILSQSASGSMNPGSSVSIKVATGKKISVADKRGTSESAFRSYLSGLGLNPGNISYAYDDSIVSGSIIRNDTGTFASGSSISYTVSRGAYSFSYGSLINAGSAWSALDSASAEARANGWSVTASWVESSTYDSGIITEACAVSGKSIRCNVSSGKVVTVPDVTGMSYTAGVEAMNKAGLKASTTETSSYRSEPAGQIIGQSIAAGSTVKSGSSVTLTVSKGPKPVETAALPSFNIALWDGRSESEIRSDMTQVFSNAGFSNLKFIVEDTSSGDNINGIKSISPSPDGSQIDKETTITIVILAGKSS